MDIRYRMLDPKDQHLLATVIDDVFDHPIEPDMATRFLRDPAHAMGVALHRDRVVGMVSGNEYLHPDKPVQFWINEMGVAKGYRRQGIGRRLLSLMLDEGRRRGHQSVWLATERDNLPARALYSAAGGDAEDCVMYSFRLDPP